MNTQAMQLLSYKFSAFVYLRTLPFIDQSEGPHMQTEASTKCVHKFMWFTSAACGQNTDTTPTNATSCKVTATDGYVYDFSSIKDLVDGDFKVQFNCQISMGHWVIVILIFWGCTGCATNNATARKSVYVYPSMLMGNGSAWYMYMYDIMCI